MRKRSTTSSAGVRHAARLAAEAAATEKEVAQLLERVLRILAKDPDAGTSKRARECLRLVVARLGSFS
jgi:hypothetical protein